MTTWAQVAHTFMPKRTRRRRRRPVKSQNHRGSPGVRSEKTANSGKTEHSRKEKMVSRSRQPTQVFRTDEQCGGGPRENSPEEQRRAEETQRMEECTQKSSRRPEIIANEPARVKGEDEAMGAATVIVARVRNGRGEAVVKDIQRGVGKRSVACATCGGWDEKGSQRTDHDKCQTV